MVGGHNGGLKVSTYRRAARADWMHNMHAGESLAREFMQPCQLDAAALAAAIDVPPDQLRAVIWGATRLDAGLDLRLARYFRLPEGFFLGLQSDYELLEAKRALGDQLGHIVPRAA